MNFKNIGNTATHTYNTANCTARKWIYNGYHCSNKYGNLVTCVVERFTIYINNVVIRDISFPIGELRFGPICPQRTAHDILEMIKDKRTNTFGTDSTTCFSENSSYFKIHLNENDFANKKFVKSNSRGINVIKIEIQIGTAGKDTTIDPIYPLLAFNQNSYQSGTEKSHFQEEFLANVTTNNRMVLYFKEQNFAIIDSEKTVKKTQAPNYYGRSK
jgi:hypothetical protein